MATKKYVSLSKLSIFLDNLKSKFATKTSVDELSADVAYINETDNESVVNPDVETSDIVIDSALSESSANPVQNRVITEKINEINETLANLPTSEDEEVDVLIEADLLPAATDASGAILTDENGNVILRY